MNGFYSIILNMTGFTGLSGYIFGLHQFPEEIDETQSTFGGKNNSVVTNIPSFKFYQNNCGHLVVIINNLAGGD
jgi:hypothetical protein